jgi:hypothetical protein
MAGTNKLERLSLENSFQDILILMRMEGTYPSVALQDGVPSIARKKCMSMKKLDGDKRSSLFFGSVIREEEKGLISLTPGGFVSSRIILNPAVGLSPGCPVVVCHLKFEKKIRFII